MTKPKGAEPEVHPTESAPSRGSLEPTGPAIADHPRQRTGSGKSRNPAAAPHLADGVDPATTADTHKELDLALLLHTLGLNARRRDPWRNHYVTDSPCPEIDALVAAGLMEPTRRPGFLAFDERVYRATDHGKAVAIAENARRNPPPSREKARYDRWLTIRDVCPDLTFGAFLKGRKYDNA